VNYRHFVLGMLGKEPMSGYDIKSALDGLEWLVGNPSFGSIYSTLHALLEDGLVTVQVIPQQVKPARKVYSISDAGRRLLQKWEAEAEPSGDSTKAFVMRLIMADSISRAGLIEQLRRRREQVAAQRASLEEDGDGNAAQADRGSRLVWEYGLALADTELAWLDDTLGRLFEQTLATEGVETG
jgi:PadR family transcriptional regulator AphA